MLRANLERTQMSEAYNVGDVLKRTKTSLVQYPLWKATQGRLLSIKVRMVSDTSMGASDKAMYHARYSPQEKYPLFEMIVDCNGVHHLVSQFTFNKD